MSQTGNIGQKLKYWSDFHLFSAFFPVLLTADWYVKAFIGEWKLGMSVHFFFFFYPLFLFWRLWSSESVARTKFPSRTLSVTESITGLKRTHKTHGSVAESGTIILSCVPSAKKYTHLPGSSRYIDTGRPVDSANNSKPWSREDNDLSQGLEKRKSSCFVKAITVSRLSFAPGTPSDKKWCCCEFWWQIGRTRPQRDTALSAWPSSALKWRNKAEKKWIYKVSDYNLTSASVQHNQLIHESVLF